MPTLNYFKIVRFSVSFPSPNSLGEKIIWEELGLNPVCLLRKWLLCSTTWWDGGTEATFIWYCYQVMIYWLIHYSVVTIPTCEIKLPLNLSHNSLRKSVDAIQWTPSWQTKLMTPAGSKVEGGEFISQEWKHNWPTVRIDCSLGRRDSYSIAHLLIVLVSFIWK